MPVWQEGVLHGQEISAAYPPHAQSGIQGAGGIGGPARRTIHFFSRSAPEYALLASDFLSFLEELEKREFKIIEWVEELKASPYDWST